MPTPIRVAGSVDRSTERREYALRNRVEQVHACVRVPRAMDVGAQRPARVVRGTQKFGPVTAEGRASRSGSSRPFTAPQSVRYRRSGQQLPFHLLWVEFHMHVR